MTQHFPQCVRQRSRGDRRTSFRSCLPPILVAKEQRPIATGCVGSMVLGLPVVDRRRVRVQPYQESQGKGEDARGPYGQREDTDGRTVGYQSPDEEQDYSADEENLLGPGGMGTDAWPGHEIQFMDR